MHNTKWVGRDDLHGHDARTAPPRSHLLAHLIFLPIAAWALLTVLDFRAASNVVLWLVAAVILHDLVLLPLYSGVDRAAPARVRRRDQLRPRPRRASRC